MMSTTILTPAEKRAYKAHQGSTLEYLSEEEFANRLRRGECDNAPWLTPGLRADLEAELPFAFPSDDPALPEGWTQEHQELALQEGWGVWLADGSTPAIQRSDEAETFASDWEAIGWVVAMAYGCGSKLHRKAWDIVYGDR